MTTVVGYPARTARLLAPVTAVLRASAGPTGVPGLVPDLLVPDDTGWRPATRLVDGSGLADLFEAARRRWQASAHVAAALAWKSYSYWLALPAVLGWASARRVPLLYPADVLTRLDEADLLTLGLRRSVAVAVLPADPLARRGPPQVRVVGDEAELLAALRRSLFDAHLSPLLDAVQAQARVGTRTLLGSVSAGIANGLLRAGGVLPGPVAGHIGTLLAALGIEDLIELVPGPGGAPAVRRRTCCLKFTLPQPRVCADCCIAQ